MAASWHPSGVPKLVLVLCGWPTPTCFASIGCWYELLTAVDLGADTTVQLSAKAKAGFLQQVETGELSFTLDQRPRWNRPQPGQYSAGPVSQLIDLRSAAAAATRAATEPNSSRPDRLGWVPGGDLSLVASPQPAEVEWVLAAAAALSTATFKTAGGRWVLMGLERLEYTFRSAVEEALYVEFTNSVLSGRHIHSAVTNWDHGFANQLAEPSGPGAPQWQQPPRGGDRFGGGGSHRRKQESPRGAEPPARASPHG